MGKRILHVIGGMNRGEIETWLVQILRRIDRERFQMDFLVHTTQPCAYDEEIIALGGQIIRCLHPSQLSIYASNFQQVLRKYGPYDVVHSHVHYFNGYILRLAQQSGISTRIAHSHIDTSIVESQAKFSRLLYFSLMKGWIERYATHGLGCSHNALVTLFGENWKTKSQWQILPYGIDLNPFVDVIDPTAMRAELGIPKDSFVIGHVGRFHEPKNYNFLLEIVAEVAQKKAKMYLLLIGEGSRQLNIKQQILQMGLGDRVIFAGSRSDIPRLMRGAMDVFLFPSLHEGANIALIAAQAAGLPCIFADVIPQEAEVVKPLLRRVSLSQPASEWAEIILAQRHAVSMISEAEALMLLKQTQFTVEKSLEHLQSIYQA